MNFIGFCYSNIYFFLILRTVIDTYIVSPNGFDFYLNSDAPMQNTAKAMHYQVLYDEIVFTSDDIQQLM
jgi:eukaryotic translation initiation factor 2C